MRAKTIFYCTECGNETPKWVGKCPACGSWNTMVEQPQEAKKKGSPVAQGISVRGSSVSRPKSLAEVETTDELRFPTGLSELDRVLGGGAVQGSLVLVGGAPGIGKSTLMLQICDNLCRFSKVLYVSGEESERQIKLRAERLGVRSESLYLLAETSLENILESVHELKPDVLIVDSIQTMYDEEQTTSPGSVGQVKCCTMSLMQLAKGEGITVFVIGHVNKEGSIAGPKVLEHMVDCVLYFEGEPHMSYRILRAAKNRFGATNEIGVFEMADSGLVEVPNPSETLLAGRPKDTPGTCVTCVMEGNRPVLAEIQALLAPTSFGNPRRTSNGFDYNRAMLLLAVLEKRGGLIVSSCDAYMNVIGGLYLDEPAADLAAIISIASSFRDKPVPGELTAIGEVGLTGELRSVSALGQRLSEVRRLGFKRCLIPAQNSMKLVEPEGLQLVRVRNIREALSAVL
ncbi:MULTISPECIES: DNA repair protein RadA [Intestinimonas]|jgi:DNA repair protein RadA/Sms|uniref:DNA repair protein RadA n=1 Tax=Intestinimonas butyriciproducens TaxID=1297617 RepID=A0A0S2W3W1_9FIRM|nr:DNA repair protein RadA [Intestinimonas butyriciproducens]ALP94038.1 DNA repair protein RadA [Intestinimonas butyriciproducens]MBO3280018.1 DNA repair protein RadA [Intestinimonas butyriciproducens]MBS6521885.1 DNA repair protein RadA [Clostridiales bacterium]MCB7049250.1 DNA repair protein RadA [Intestinimonas butyriciproducens]